MFIVLSPAKSLDESPAPAGYGHSEPGFLYDTEQLLKKTRRLKPRDLKKLMGISDKLAELNHERYQQLEPPFTPENAKQAALMFNGDVYAGLDASSLDPVDLDWAQDKVGILSGLYGLLRPLDLIQPYRLEMGTSLKTRRGASLYAFWGGRIAKEINQRMADHEQPVLVNLASAEYFRAIDKKKLRAQIITPVFHEITGEKRRAISFLAKRARGMMARYAILTRAEGPEALKGFTQEGYRFNEALSTDDKWIFDRPYIPVGQR